MIGTTIFVYGKYLMIRSMRKTDALPGTFFVILMGVLLVFWFQVPHLFPYTLLAMAILFSSGKKESLPQWVGTIKAWSLRFALSRMTLMGSALLLCSMGLFHGITQYSYTQTFNKPDKTLDIKVSAFATSPLMDIDKLFGGVRHSALAGGLSGQVFKAIDQIKPDAPERPQHIQEGIRIQQQIIDALQQYPGSNMSALIQVTNIYAHLITNKNTAPYVRLIPDFVETWDSAIDLVLQHLPYRSDVLVPYLSMLTTSKRWKRLDDITTLLIKAKPNDPITLWFKGVYLIHSDYTYRDGMLMLKKSIQLGITRFMPLPQQELDRILNAEIDEND
ncbi:hypothetical protein OAN22_01370 [Alphaproteobacteria bacterium]|nr:hypothetical protein [Alphaproteobacteria bacterium]